PHWVVLVLAITWGYDTGAYFAGRYLGTHAFMSHISPSKTIEGVAGGLAVSTLAGLAAASPAGLTVLQGLALGLAGGAIVQAGDLVESMMKRAVGVKDSGTLVSGHGGLLDRG